MLKSSLESGNRVLFSSSVCQDGFFVNLFDLFGEKIWDLLEEAENLIYSCSDFKATKENPYPSRYATSNHDLAAVIAGRKPAAMVRMNNVENNPLAILLLNELEFRGYLLEVVSDFSTFYTGNKVLVAGMPYNVKTICDIMNRAVSSKNSYLIYYYQMHELLGHPVGYCTPENNTFNWITEL